MKKANIIHHDVEASIFERAYPEGSSIHERFKVSKSMADVVGMSARFDLEVKAKKFAYLSYRTFVELLQNMVPYGFK